MNYHIEFDIDFKRNPYKGKYIAVEGVDGSGKTTQVERLASYFEEKGQKVIKVREPRKEGLIGDLIQKVLVGNVKIPSVALQYLFSTDRVMHHEEVILPALEEGSVVISDRCFWSAIVYGILDRTGQDYDYKDGDLLLISQSILSMYHQFLIPDFNFYLKIPLVESMLRLSKKSDKKEIYEEEGKLKKLIEGYEWLTKKFKNEFTIINGEQNPEKVTQDIIKHLETE